MAWVRGGAYRFPRVAARDARKDLHVAHDPSAQGMEELPALHPRRAAESMLSIHGGSDLRMDGQWRVCLEHVDHVAGRRIDAMDLAVGDDGRRWIGAHRTLPLRTRLWGIDMLDLRYRQLPGPPERVSNRQHRDRRHHGAPRFDRHRVEKWANPAISPRAITMDTARATFEVQNDVVTLDAETRHIYEYDADAYQRLLRDAPWRDDVHYFQRVRISVVALMKMVLHARLGGANEVMGLMQGTVCADTRTFYILDAFALPVHGTETRVNAQNEAYEYMIQFLEQCSATHRPQQAVGWYHSHPGYRCWLSGIDVETQQTNQRQDPFVAVVVRALLTQIDPHHTMTTGQVDIGAFRTYPSEYRAESRPARRGALPMHKADDYGAHADRYYPLDVELFTTSADRPLFSLLWNEYWAHTLCTSPSVLQRTLGLQHTQELVAQLRDARTHIANGSMLPGGASYTQAGRSASSIPHAEPAQQLAAALEQRAADQPLAKISAEAYVHTLTQRRPGEPCAPRAAARVAQVGPLCACRITMDYHNMYGLYGIRSAAERSGS